MGATLNHALLETQMVQWFNPRDGKANAVGTFENNSGRKFHSAGQR